MVVPFEIEGLQLLWRRGEAERNTVAFLPSICHAGTAQPAAHAAAIGSEKSNRDDPQSGSAR
ncbi:hypothetical protein [Sulfurisoma sediminicola]|uniref:hypothetical protein n=1 Tax=Sulfurisoma sediminicola TaxID=1381557 RepID=UPI000F6092F0|nr:hypothetical protein [Sulfurisoma sediminicola]